MIARLSKVEVSPDPADNFLLSCGTCTRGCISTICRRGNPIVADDYCGRCHRAAYQFRITFWLHQTSSGFIRLRINVGRRRKWLIAERSQKTLFLGETADRGQWQTGFVGHPAIVAAAEQPAVRETPVFEAGNGREMVRKSPASHRRERPAVGEIYR